MRRLQTICEYYSRTDHGAGSKQPIVLVDSESHTQAQAETDPGARKGEAPSGLYYVKTEAKNLVGVPRRALHAAFCAQNGLPGGSGSPLVAAAEERRQATASIPHARASNAMFSEPFFRIGTTPKGNR